MQIKVQECCGTVGPGMICDDCGDFEPIPFNTDSLPPMLKAGFPTMAAMMDGKSILLPGLYLCPVCERVRPRY